jgi:toxin ParE1/3/4
MRPCIFHPQATIELEEAVAHYESLRTGKGLELADCIEAMIERIREFPEAAPIVLDSIRSIGVQPSSRWRYSVYYRVTPSEIRVLAIAHHRRQPFY